MTENFYGYENWIQDRARVYGAECLYCNHGRGIHGTRDEESGKWHSLFSDRDRAYRFAARRDRTGTDFVEPGRANHVSKVLLPTVQHALTIFPAGNQRRFCLSSRKAHQSERSQELSFLGSLWCCQSLRSDTLRELQQAPSGKGRITCFRFASVVGRQANVAKSSQLECRVVYAHFMADH